MAKIVLNDTEYEIRPLLTGDLRRHALALAEVIKKIDTSGLADQAAAGASLMLLREDVIRKAVVCDDIEAVIEGCYQGDIEDAYLLIMNSSRSARASDFLKAPIQSH